MTDHNQLPFTPEPPEDAELEARLVAMYASTPAADPSSAARCAAAVLAQAGSQNTAARDSRLVILRPTTRWWWGVAAAAVLVTATTYNWPSDGRSSAPSVRDFTPNVAAGELKGSVTELNGKSVRFDLTLPSVATGVSIVGDFNGWDENATPMAQQGNGWSANIPLSPGRHVYAFVVDGKRWIVDPMAPQVPNDGFGPTNAVIVDGGSP
jgi:hypothetical protein